MNTTSKLAFAVAAWASSSACAPSPAAAIEVLRSALVACDVPKLTALIDPEYFDPIGGRDALLRDVEELHDAYGGLSLDFSNLSMTRGGTDLLVHVTGELNAELTGKPTYKIVGPLSIDLKQSGGMLSATTGLLSDLRDIRSLMSARRAAIEANDAAAYKHLLHPSYRDGDLDLESTAARLATELGQARIRIDSTNYRIEVRGPLSHVDEYYRLTVQARTYAPAVGRFTLARSLGRWRIIAGLYPPKSSSVASSIPMLEPGNRSE